MIHKTFDIVVEEKRKDGGRIVISTGGLDRDKDRVLPEGGNFENYLKNPVVQWGHNYRDPWATIGKTNSINVSNNNISVDFDLRPPANDQDPQNIILLLWNGNWIRTASIGFDPGFIAHAWEDNEDGGRDFTEWELLEWSLVPIPANQDALRLAVKGIEGAEPEIHSYMLDTSTGSATWLAYDPLEQRPYPNEHACRLRSPDDFQSDSFRRVKREHEGKTYYVIMGRLQGETSMTEQAYRYPKDTWTAAQARAHCKSHDGQRFEPASSESASADTATDCCGDTDIPIPQETETQADTQPPADADIQPADADTSPGNAPDPDELTPEEEAALAEALEGWLEQINETIGA